MPLDAEAMAASVVLAIKTALAPVQMRLQAVHDQVLGLDARWADLNLLRERLAAVETKAAPAVTPERGEKGDRGDTGPVGVAGERGEKGDKGETGEKGLDGASGRDGVDGEAGPPGPPGARGDKGEPGEPGVRGGMGPAGQDGVKGDSGERGERGEKGDPGTIGRDGQPGVQGPQGLSGRDGSLENLKALFDGERTVTLAFKNGDPVEGGVIKFTGLPIFRGVYQTGKTYDAGDTVMKGGDLWHCNTDATVTLPGESRQWQLIVRRGRDGRDAAPTTSTQPLPVVRTR